MSCSFDLYAAEMYIISGVAIVICDKEVAKPIVAPL